MTLAGEWTLYFLAAAFLYILPGWALLDWLWKSPPLVFFEKLGLSSGLSLSIYPILMLYFYIAGVVPGRFLAWAPGILAALSLAIRKHHKIFLVFRNLFWRKTEEPNMDFEITAGSALIDRNRLPLPLIAMTILLLSVTRLAAIRNMPAPAWGDSVHHTVAVQRMLENGGLFQSWAPYAPIASFTYHFGFHASAAVWSWLTGLPAPQAVLVCGQVINVLAVLAFFPARVWRRKRPGRDSQPSSSLVS